MPRYIDADKFRNWILKQKRLSKYYTVQMLDETTPVDVEEITRCKDCTYCDKVDKYELWCTGRGFPIRLTTPNDYCSYAERRK